MNELVEQLRFRACSVDEQPEHDHGHTDCYLERAAADEIERLRGELHMALNESDMLRLERDRLYARIIAWADADLHVTPYGPSIHPIIDAENALRKAVGR